MGDLQLDGRLERYMRRYLKEDDAEFGFYLDSEIQSVCAEYDAVAMMAMNAVKGPITHAQFRLTGEVAEWHRLRCRMKAEALWTAKEGWGPPWGPVRIHAGAVYTDPKTKTTVSAWWTHDFVLQRLYICKLTVKRRQGLEVGIRLVLRAAVMEAKWFNLREIIAWDPIPRVVAQAERLVGDLGQDMTATLENRSEMVPCFRWHGGEEKEVVWTESEYFGWC